MTGLEALKQVKNFLGYNYCSVDLPDELATIEKSLKALEIIKKKNVNIYQIKYMETLDDYNSVRDEEDRLTQEEYETIKEVLE